MVRVKSFLCCFSLECMGLFIGWSNVIFYAIAVLLLGVAALGFETEPNSSLMFFIPIIICILWAFIYSRFIGAVNSRDAERILCFRNYRIFTTITLILEMYGIREVAAKSGTYKGDTSLIASFFLNLIFEIYVVICIHSLHKKFEEGKLPTTNMAMAYGYPQQGNPQLGMQPTYQHQQVYQPGAQQVYPNITMVNNDQQKV